MFKICLISLLLLLTTSCSCSWNKESVKIELFPGVDGSLKAEVQISH